MKHYVNGKQELIGKVNFNGIGEGTISIGVRQNMKSWFRGTIKMIKFTNQALPIEKFEYCRNKN